ncbi:Two component regulator propeller [Algoriphagus locisalis]|uniref:Two component regulator propeller n=2 Tax=Algoriphagus locisalis TaxID=305507 RepID=A0A1I6XC66_9BACT|nr:Two component regulator propeller [Algoriphagus locisalis]
MNCLVVKPAFTQSQPASTDNLEIAQNYVMEIWDNTKGMPQNTIFAMEKDNFGFLWAATEEGLVRFDGKTLKVFSQDSYPEMLEQTYYTFFKTKGGIWASGDRSIILIDKTIKTVIDCSEIADKTWIRGIAENGKGGLLIGNQKGEIFSWDQGTFSPLSFWNPSIRLEILGFHSIENSIILVGTTQGIYELNLETAQSKLITAQDFSALKIFSNANSLYVYGQEKGIFRIEMDYRLEKVYSFEQLDGVNPSSLIVDSDNTIWAGSLENGLIKMSDGKVDEVIFPELHSYTVRKIIKKDDNVYLGTVGKGLTVVRPAKIKQLTAEALKQKNIKPIYQAGDSSIWIGTKSDGLFQLKNGVVNSWTDQDGLLQNRVNTIGSANGKVYVGSTSGVTIIDQKSGKVTGYLTQENGLLSNYVGAIFRDSKNWLWILTRKGGIHYFDEKGNFNQIELPENYSNTIFISILELKNKQVLVGSINHGFLRFENNQLVENEILPLTPGEDVIYSFYEDAAGDLWFATHGGIVLLYQGEFKVLRKRHGLKSRSVFSIIHDGNVGVWVTHNFGIQYFPDSELEKFKLDTDEDFHIATSFYSESQGMPNSEANGLIFPSTIKDNMGRIWIPTVEGVGIIQDPLPKEELPKDFLFIWDNLQIGDQKIDIQDEILIPQGVGMFQVSFSLIDFENPNQYSLFYRINSKSEQWQPIKDQRFLNFTGLKPGDYTLQIKIHLHGNLEEIHTLPIRVKAIWFESIAFKILALLAFGILIYFVMKHYSHIRLKRKLERMVSLRTAELSKANRQLKKAFSEIENKNKVLLDITWNQSHLVRAPLTKAMGIAEVLNNYTTYQEIGLSKEELEKELLETLELLDQVVRETHAMSENIKNNER